MHCDSYIRRFKKRKEKIFSGEAIESFLTDNEKDGRWFQESQEVRKEQKCKNKKKKERKKNCRPHSLESELKSKTENNIFCLFFCHALQQVELPSALIIASHYDT